jgi:hypothetical protein
MHFQVNEPTVAEKHLARTMAYWHGTKTLYRRPDGQLVCVADLREEPSGWTSRFDRYVDRHWEEYVPAARAFLEQR